MHPVPGGSGGAERDSFSPSGRQAGPAYGKAVRDRTERLVTRASRPRAARMKTKAGPLGYGFARTG
ncbi:hypothetical protein GCM10022295_17830 [Streptomyces osmaniensis]|uniref:Uncharacterized protein n=1 Tax=Streptomyces osmaniensis TaxID=593134 RepID=A0ABP6VLW5_9ACTN